MQAALGLYAALGVDRCPAPASDLAELSKQIVPTPATGKAERF